MPGYRAWGALKSILSNKGLGIKAKKCLYEGVIVPTMLYGAEAWGMGSGKKKKVNVLEMKCYVTASFHPSPGGNHHSSGERSERTQCQAKWALETHSVTYAVV